MTRQMQTLFNNTQWGIYTKIKPTSRETHLVTEAICLRALNRLIDEVEHSVC